MAQLSTIDQNTRTPLSTYLADIRSAELLAPEEERELWLRHAAGDRWARERLVTGNLRLVVNVARQYQGRGLNLIDLIGEGNLALLRAVDHFDLGRGIRFSTYASTCIKHALIRSLQKTGRSIRLPAYMVALLAKWREAQRELKHTLGREPNTEELRERLQIRPKRFARLKEALAVCCMVEASKDVGDLALEHGLADTRGGGPDSGLLEREVREQIRRMLDDLDEREALVIRLRYGLDGERPRTLQEIGAVCGLTRERVRQIQAAVLSRFADRLVERASPPRRTRAARPAAAV